MVPWEGCPRITTLFETIVHFSWPGTEAKKPDEVDNTKDQVEKEEEDEEDYPN